LISIAAGLGPRTLLILAYLVGSAASELITHNGVVMLLMPQVLALAE
jgi:Na+/H+ antiporter NhaD/arsenite permease-like protein